MENGTIIEKKCIRYGKVSGLWDVFRFARRPIVPRVLTSRASSLHAAHSLLGGGASNLLVIGEIQKASPDENNFIIICNNFFLSSYIFFFV